MIYSTRRLLLTSLSILALGTSAASAQGLTEAQVNDLIKKYIAAHPQEIVDSLNAWQLQEETGRVEKQKEALKTVKDTAFSEAYLPRAGNPKGDVTLIEFFDYNCPACKAAFEAIDTVMKQDKNLRVIFVEFPIFGPQSEENAKLGLAVYKHYPDKYFDFHSGLMRHKGKIDLNFALNIAKNLGMDTGKLSTEIKKEEYATYISKDRETASKLMIQGTPAIIVGDYFNNGAVGASELKSQIEWSRSGKKD